MCSWINRVKESIAKIIDQVKIEYFGMKIRISFVGYRDFYDPDKDHFEIIPFNDNI